MANQSQDWRETEQRLRDLPDHELRSALAEAGVRAVLPSDRKARSTPKVGGELGDSTTRWANGEWQERISLENLPDAQKFLENPDKPPTLAMPRGAALSSPSPARRPWGAVVVGLLGTGGLLTLLVFAMHDQAFLDRPRVEANAASAPASRAAADAAQAASAAAAAARDMPGSRAGQGTEPALAEPLQQNGALLAGPARPAGSPSKALDEAAREREARRLRYLSTQAKGGDVRSMILLARALVERGDANAAMKWAGRAKARQRRSIEARIVLGDAQMLAGYGKAAEQTWRHALARAPGNLALKQRLGEE